MNSSQLRSSLSGAASLPPLCWAAAVLLLPFGAACSSICVQIAPVFFLVSFQIHSYGEETPSGRWISKNRITLDAFSHITSHKAGSDLLYSGICTAPTSDIVQGFRTKLLNCDIVYCRESPSFDKCYGFPSCSRTRFCEGDTRNRWRDGQVCPDVDKELWRLGPDGSGVFWRWTSVSRCGQGTMAPWARRLGCVLACYAPIGRGRSRETLVTCQ
ncbi:hypothetical protein TNCV_3617431 [Trichonephila clavipes]|nr:hypothetical protein TNCV_3617431 [Trichonephila clavipes]